MFQQKRMEGTIISRYVMHIQGQSGPTWTKDISAHHMEGREDRLDWITYEALERKAGRLLAIQQNVSADAMRETHDFFIIQQGLLMARIALPTHYRHP